MVKRVIGATELVAYNSFHHSDFHPRLKGVGGGGKRIPGAPEARKTREGSVGNACKDAMGFFRFSHLPE